MVAGNWKMNGSLEMAGVLVRAVAQAEENNREILLCPPFPYLQTVRDLIGDSGLQLGAQNCAADASGAFTGEVSAAMLKDLGCSYVILGHSERRALYGETDEIVARKTRAALDAGLKVVLCVGETLEQRKSGVEEQVVAEQMKLVLDSLGTADWDELVVAYEPVWAIGTGETATPEQAQAMHAFIRNCMGETGSNVQILYGGSVKPDSAAGLFAQSDIDGGLIGGASLDAEQFLKICAA